MGLVVIPKHGCANGDAFAIIQGAGADALEIGVHRIKTILTIGGADHGKGLKARLGVSLDGAAEVIHGGKCLGSHTLGWSPGADLEEPPI